MTFWRIPNGKEVYGGAGSVERASEQRSPLECGCDLLLLPTVATRS